MTDNEKVQKAKQLIAEANMLLDEVKAAHDEEKDVIAKYKDNYCNGEKYFLDNCSMVSHTTNDDGFDEVKSIGTPYQYYPTKELAEQAKELKDFNDKLLAFKYCYDLDYKPDWEDPFKGKYYVYYNSEDDKYDYDWNLANRRNTVYFSSKEIAQKCADWLNSLK